MQLASVYRPAGHRETGSGDWFDLLCFGGPSTGNRVRSTSTAAANPTGRDDVLLVIGDAAGHDGGAAVAMARTRTLLRTAVRMAGPDPAAVLALTDAMLTALNPPTIVTAAVYRLVRESERSDPCIRDRTGGGTGGGTGDWSVTWSSAGHPPAVLVAADGVGVQLLDARPDPLLGTCTEPRRVAHHRTVACGSTLLLYTDGLIERRGEHLDTGLTRLQRHASNAGPTLTCLLDTLLDRMHIDPDQDRRDGCQLSPDRADGGGDDVALLAARLG